MPFPIIDKHVLTGQGRTVIVTNERKMYKGVRASPVEGGPAPSLSVLSP